VESSVLGIGKAPGGRAANQALSENRRRLKVGRVVPSAVHSATRIGVGARVVSRVMV
jgi:hypothetical protein